MYSVLLFLHSIFRWLVLVSLVYSIYRAFRGYTLRLAFSKTDNAIRHWTVTLAHIQLMIGMVLYFKSPLVQHFWSRASKVPASKELTFFSLIHLALMLVSIILITIGSAKAKRQLQDPIAFKTIFTWYLVALILIFIAIPWPFSPLANRPYIR
ncbi:hypothetical protein ACTJIJ_21420 [Niabella sp. 22666]|uniref:hypothetical protein n=1 Tax=Niabella sp. 22666 TaxID=3453954 RepID=UPI003F8328E7